MEGTLEMAVRQWWMMGWPATSKRGCDGRYCQLFVVGDGWASRGASQQLKGWIRVSVWIVDEPWGHRGRGVGSECLEMRRQPVDRDIVSDPIVAFVVCFIGKGRCRTGTDQNHSFGGPMVVAVGPWPVGDLEGGHDARRSFVGMAVSDPRREEGSEQRRRWSIT